MLQLVSDEQVEEIGQVCRWVAAPVGGFPMSLRVGMRAACSVTCMPLLHYRPRQYAGYRWVLNVHLQLLNGRWTNRLGTPPLICSCLVCRSNVDNIATSMRHLEDMQASMEELRQRMATTRRRARACSGC